MIIYQALKRQILTNLVILPLNINTLSLNFSKNRPPTTQKPFYSKPPPQQKYKPQRGNHDSRNIKSILTFYTKQVSKENFALQNIVSICRQLTQQYKRQTHLQFALQRRQIEELLQHLARIELKDATFQDFLTIMQLIKALKNVQNISRVYLQTVKDIVLLKILPFKQKFQVLSFQKQVRLYSILSSFQHIQSGRLESILQKTITNALQQQNRNWSINLTQLLQVLSKKQKWQTAEQQLIQLIFRKLSSNLQNFDSIQVLKIASILNSDRFLILKNINVFNPFYSSIVQKLNNILKNQIQPKTLKYALSSNMMNGNFLNKFYRNLYQIIFSSIAAKQSNYFLLQNLCNVVSKLRGKHARQEDATKVIDFICFIIGNKKLKESFFQKKRCEIYLLELIQLRYFDNSIKLLDKIITKEQIQIYWSFPFEYSVRQVKFPIEVLVSKIKPGSLNFKQDSNYLKMAVSIAVQTWLHDDEKLEQYFEQVKSKVNSSKFTINEIDWLIKQYQINPTLVRLYHKYYCKQFEEMLYKTYSPLLFNQQKDSNKYWIYLLNVCQPNDKFIKKIPYKVIKLSIQRQFQTFQNQNSIINALIVKKLIQMLKGLQNVKQLQFAKNKADFQFIFREKIVKDLLLWFDRLPNSSKQAAELYIQLIILLLNKHVKESWQMPQSLKILTCKLVICDYRIIRQTKYFGNLKTSIQQSLKNQELAQILGNLRTRREIQEGKNLQK